MPLGVMNTLGSRQSCPNCGFGPEYPFEFKELVALYPSYRDGNLIEDCEIAEIFRKIACRQCGFIIGLNDDTDSLQQKALAYGIVEEKIEEELVEALILKESEEVEEESTLEESVVENTTKKKILK